MKNLFFFLCFTLIYISLNAQNYLNQKYDRQRIIMDALSGGCYNLDPNDTVYRIGTLFDFNDDTLRMQAIDTFINQNIPVKYWTYGNNAQICDTAGRIAAYFNGSQLWDRYGNAILLEVFGYFQPFPYSSKYSYNNAIILPVPDKQDEFILICVNDYQMEGLPYNSIAPEGLTSVRFKLLPDGRLSIGTIVPSILKDKLPFFGVLSACRHANGRDWWIVAPRRFSKDMHSFLLSPDTLKYIGIQTLKDTIVDQTFVPGFSPDGNWYARGETYKHVSMYEKLNRGQTIPFDRCSGTFGDPITFKIPYEDTSSLSQIIYSKSSKYFYLINSLTIWQGESDASDPIKSLIRVCRYDPKIVDYGYFLVFGMAFLAPDGKIYVFDGNNNFRVTVINNPDERGMACDARYASIMKPSCTGGSLGNMPDFNLGPLDGSPCDTLGLDATINTYRTQATVPLSIYPNPSPGSFTVLIPSQQGVLRLSDARGMPIRTIAVHDFQMKVNIALPPGIYIATYTSADGKIITSGKVVVE